jgi:REP element-mobilizing transposase RayT
MSLGEIVRRFKATSSRITGIKLWQPNYYEHVIRNEKALYKIREYIQNNPLKKQIELDQIYEK